MHDFRVVSNLTGISLTLSRLLELRGLPAQERFGDHGPVENLSALRRACESEGLRFALMAAPMSALLRALQPAHPALALTRNGGVLIVTEALAGKFRVERSVGGAMWWTPEELARELGLSGVNAEAEWLVSADIAAHPHAGEDVSPWAHVASLLSPEKGDIASVAIYAAVAGVLSLTLPLAVQALVNTVAFGTLVQPIVFLALVLCAGLAFAAFLQGLQAWTVEILQRRLFVRLVSDLADRLPRVHVSAFEAGHGPELLNRFFDVFLAQKALASLLLGGIEAFLTVVVGLILLAFYHPFLLAFGACILVCAGLIGGWLGRGAAHTSIVESKAKYAVAGWMEEMARHIFALKSSGGAEFARRRLDRLAAKWLEKRAAHFRIAFRQRIGTLALQVIASATLLGLGGWLVVQRELTVGQLVAAELVVSAVVASLSKLGAKLETVYDLVASAEKLATLRSLPLERQAGDRTRRGPAAAELVLERSSRDDRGTTVTVARQATLGILSPGAGESRIVNALFGLREWDRGVIRLDGDDIRDLALGDLRDRVMVVRSAETLPGTIGENLGAVGRPVEARELWEALGDVGLEEHVRELPEGLSTRLFHDGHPLTGRQSMRVTIARAILSRPGLVVLDGCLDAFSPADQASMLKRLVGRMSVVCVTRDARVAALCDSFVEEDAL